MAGKQGWKASAPTAEEQVKKIIKIGLLVVMGFVLLVVFLSSFYTVTSGDEAVLLTFNKAEVGAIGAGLHFKIPIVQHVIKFDVKTQKYETHATAASKDLQDVATQVAVNYHITPQSTPNLFTQVGAGYEDRLIQPAVQEVVKGVTAKFTAEELITRRAEVSSEILELLKARLVSRDLIVENIAITNFEFSKSFTDAIEKKVTAEQQSLEQKNLLEKIKYEANQRVASAEGERDSKIAIATGEAEATKLNAEAEATRVKLVQDQLKQSPQYIDYIRATKWNGAYPNFYMTGGNTPTMLLNVPAVPAVGQ